MEVSPMTTVRPQLPAYSPDSAQGHAEPFPRLSSDSRDFGPSSTGGMHSEKWFPRRNSRAGFARSTTFGATTRHGRQKSLSEAISTIRTRKGSMSQNAHEIADALKAPVSPKLVAICAAWYITSMIANTSAGEILNTFPKPVTLTITQFALVTIWCLVLSWLSSVYPALKNHLPVLRNGIRPPNRDIIMATLPLTGFMIGGHILTSDAMSRIPVSLVHTIKGLSPLITVVAYRFIFHIRYSWPTYLSLVPLTLGVIMACSTTFASNTFGLAVAFASAILFVTQNIVSKQLFNEAAIAEQEGMGRGRKPDKLNLLAYSSALAFVFTFPIWFWSEGYAIAKDFWKDGSIDINIKTDSLDHGRLVLEYLFNGTFHFVQSLVAFTLLSMVSPVTYSVASLIKRVFVICFAIIWFGNKITRIQGFGIALTFLGLYLYDRTSDATRADRRAKLLGIKEQPTLLPLHEKPFESPPVERKPSPNGYPIGGEEKRSDDRPQPVHRHSSPMGNGWLPPGTKAQETWTSRDVAEAQASQPHQHAVPVS